MNNQITATFDAWVARNYNRLKQEVFNATFFDEDAFQQAYINVRKQLAGTNKEGDFRNLYLQAYRRASKRNLSEGLRYHHPDQLFFVYLRTDEPIEATTTPDEEKVTVKMVDSFVKDHLSDIDYTIFILYWNLHLTFREICDYTGHSTSTINRHLKHINERCRTHFTPPISSRKSFANK